MSLGQSVAPMNTQLQTVGGSQVQGKIHQENVLDLEVLALWLLTCIFMILGISLNF